MKTISDESLLRSVVAAGDATGKDPEYLTVKIDPESLIYAKPSGPTLPAERETTATPIIRQLR